MSRRDHRRACPLAVCVLAPVLVTAVIAAGCSLPSFEERQAAIDAADEATDPTAGDGATTATTAGGGEPAAGPVVLGDDPPADAETPTWTDLRLTATPIAEYDQPIAVARRSGSPDLYVALRTGVVRRIERTFNRNGVERIATGTSVVLDISDTVSLAGEQGLLDITFSPDSRFLYVSYTDLDGSSVVAEYDIDRRTTVRSDSRRELLRVPQPRSNHNGGAIAFGPDGFLYIALGDGGGSGDPEGAGQDTSTLLGSILRIDTVPASEDEPYTIPDGNPFVDGDGAPEIYLYGVRNPWRFSFDEPTGDLWIGDVGQNRFEEINRLRPALGAGRGANLGWNEMEADEPFDGGSPPPGHVGPVLAYAHEGGRCSVTGGVVYRGPLMPLLDGVYIFGDYCTGEVFGLDPRTDPITVHPIELDLPSEQLVSFGRTDDGEVLLVLVGGQVLRLEPAPAETE